MPLNFLPSLRNSPPRHSEDQTIQGSRSQVFEKLESNFGICSVSTMIGLVGLENIRQGAQGNITGIKFSSYSLPRGILGDLESVCKVKPSIRVPYGSHSPRGCIRRSLEWV